MCGISGKVNFSNKPVTKKEIEVMNALLKHRGPDDEGIFIGDNVGLGNRRLAIIDLSEKGHMPMSTEDGRFTITYNGEVYNFKEISKELEVKGWKFRSNSDTEVVLKSYAEFGVDCLKKLRGMFSFAIWDKKKKTLFCARDRLGKKPFKYYKDAERFIFASELKAILVDKSVPKIVDKQAINYFLSLRYVPAPLTGFLKINKLPAGHYGILDIKNGGWKVKRYWKVDFGKKEKRSESEWEEIIRNKLIESVRLRMIADVEVGSFLSGGIDSSVLTGIMAKSTSKRIKTFSVGYKESRHSELDYAKKVSDYFDTDHTELRISPKVKNDLGDIVYQYEEMFGDPAGIPTYYMSKITSRHIKVVVSGDGGDENFGGYPTYQNYKFIEHYSLLPQLLRKLIYLAGDFKSQMIDSKRLKHLVFKLEALTHNNVWAFLYNFGCFHQEVANKYYVSRDDLYSMDFKLDIDIDRPYVFVKKIFDQAYKYDYFDKVSNFNFSTYLPDQLLPKVDIASMAHSLEARSPLLDHEFVEMTSRIPSSLKLKGGESKYIFKKTFSDFVPREIIERPKQGFSVPLDEWFRGDLYNYTSSVLLDGKSLSRGYFKRPAIERLLRDHKRGVDYSNHIWLLLVLELWHRKFID